MLSIIAVSLPHISIYAGGITKCVLDVVTFAVVEDVAPVSRTIDPLHAERVSLIRTVLFLLR